MRILLFFLLSLSTSVVASAQHPVRVDPTHYGFSTSEAGSASTASASSTNRSQDETEIRNVYTRFQQAWNQHDMKAWAGLFAEDADFVNYLGEWWKGRSQIEKNLTAVHAAAFRESTLTDNIDIKYLTSDVAVVHDFWSLVGSKNPDGTAGQSRKGISTQVLRKQAGKWLIADFQNTLTVPNVAFGAELPKPP